MSGFDSTTTPRQTSRDMARSTDDLSPLQNVTLRELVEWVGPDGISRPDRGKIMRHFPGSRGSFDNCVTALKGRGLIVETQRAQTGQRAEYRFAIPGAPTGSSQREAVAPTGSSQREATGSSQREPVPRDPYRSPKESGKTHTRGRDRGRTRDGNPPRNDDFIRWYRQQKNERGIYRAITDRQQLTTKGI